MNFLIAHAATGSVLQEPKGVGSSLQHPDHRELAETLSGETTVDVWPNQTYPAHERM